MSVRRHGRYTPPSPIRVDAEDQELLRQLREDEQHRRILEEIEADRRAWAELNAQARAMRARADRAEYERRYGHHEPPPDLSKKYLRSEG